jgi:4-oxalomesaconate hydratase
MSESRSLVVVSAHAADFVWRAGGAIALHVKKLGYRASVVCLSGGERGESNEVWAAHPGLPVEVVRETRKGEARDAAAILGAEVHFLDLEDYPLHPDRAALELLVDLYRSLRPSFVLTHPVADPANWDHVRTSQLALEARQVASAAGRPGGPIHAGPQVYAFEPHQTELCGFKPDTLLDISEVWDLKWQAMQCIPSQKRMWTYYQNVAEQRAHVAGRRSERKITAAEAFQRLFPATVKEL